jgi:hypothetical protein
MDWSGYNIQININDTYLMEENNYEVLYDDNFEIFNLGIINLRNSLTSIHSEFIYKITQKLLLINNNLSKKVKLSYINKLDNNISNFIDSLVLPPLLSSQINFNIYEYYDLIKYINISKNDKIYIYNDIYNKFYDTLQILNITNITLFKKNDQLDTIKTSINKYNIWISSNIELFKVDSCDWIFFRVPWYINQLIYISHICEDNATCIFTFDLRFFQFNIYYELLILFSCFMKMTYYNDVLMTEQKCYLIGRNLNLQKLKKWCRNKQLLDSFKSSFLDNTNKLCINKRKIIYSLNLNNDLLNNEIHKILYHSSKYVNQRFKLIYNQKTQDYKYLLHLLEYNIKYTIQIIKDRKYPFDINQFYLNLDLKKTHFGILKKEFFTNYFFKINKSKLLKLQFSNNSL